MLSPLRRVRVIALVASSCALAVFASFASSTSAWASEPTTAEVLFREARELLAHGDYAAACPKLEESQRLDPAPGTEFNLARCYELTGRLASAWGAYVEVASITRTAGQSAREAHARERVAAIEPRLSFVVITMRERHEQSEDVHLLRDGREMARAQLGVAIPVDPGDHVLHASSPGKRDWETHFRIDRDAQRIAVEVPALEDAPPPLAEPSPARASIAVDTNRAPAPSGTGGGTQRTIGVSLLGASAVAAGVGIYFGLTKLSLATRARNECPDACTTPDGIKTVSDSNTAGDWSTGAFIGFGVLAAAGGILWFTAPKSPPSRSLGVTPIVTTSSAGLVVRGAFE